jgi:hypothetical protein
LFGSGFDASALEDPFITHHFVGYAQEREVISKTALGDLGDDSPLVVRTQD